MEVETLKNKEAKAELAVADARQREQGLHKEVARTRAAAAAAQRALCRVQCDIHEVAQLIQAPDKLKAAVVRLYQAQTAEGQGAAAEVDQEDGAEAARRCGLGCS